MAVVSHLLFPGHVPFGQKVTALEWQLGSLFWCLTQLQKHELNQGLNFDQSESAYEQIHSLPQNLLHLLQNLSHRIWSILLGFNCFHGQLSSIYFSCHICSLLRHLPFAINALPLPRFLLHLSCRDVISAVALVTDYGREGVEMRNPLPLGRCATAQQPGEGGPVSAALSSDVQPRFPAEPGPRAVIFMLLSHTTLTLFESLS